MLAARQNALGHVRYVLKDRLKWIPLYGFYFAQVTFVFALLFQIKHNLVKIYLIFFVLCMVLVNGRGASCILGK